MRSMFCLVLAVLCLSGASGCTKKKDGPTLWIYTSLYNPVVQDLGQQLSRKFPGVDFRWYQSGSENVAAKVNSEILSGKTQADLLLTSDPFWYEDLKQQNRLMAYTSPAAAGVPANLRDPAGFYATVRMPVMVIAYNREAIPEAEAPKSFADLAHARFRDKVAMPNPLESGTSFTTVAMLSRKLGWDYMGKLRANGVLCAGGNTAVMSRLETKERPVGIVLLENVLQARKTNPKIVAAYPSEGAVLIPSPVAITATTSQPELSRQVYDFLLSREAQEAVVRGNMYSVMPGVADPEGAQPWAQMFKSSQGWSAAVLAEIRAGRDEIKRKFAKLVLE